MQYLTPYELSKIMNDDENKIAEQGLSVPRSVHRSRNFATASARE
jgi:hypothetical protein